MAVPYSVGKVIDIVAAAGDNIKQTLRNIAALLVIVFVVGAAANFGRVYLFQSTCEYSAMADQFGAEYYSWLWKIFAYFIHGRESKMLQCVTTLLSKKTTFFVNF